MKLIFLKYRIFVFRKNKVVAIIDNETKTVFKSETVLKLKIKVNLSDHKIAAVTDSFLQTCENSHRETLNSYFD